jgi:ubiquinone/menaquinone biosynthesis C-methylase UbiE
LARPGATTQEPTRAGGQRLGSPEAATLWDRVARVYDWQLLLERRAVAAAIELAAPRPEERLLDVGTGTGAVLRALARLRSRPTVAIGLDSSERMLARVPSLPEGWRLERGEATNLPFAAGEFDVVIASYVLHLLEPPSLARVMSEVRRVLKPRGRFVTVTPVAPRSRLRRPYELIVAALAPLNGSSLGLRPLDPRAELTRSGLEPVAARYVHRGYPSLCVVARPADRRTGRTGPEDRRRAT